MINKARHVAGRDNPRLWSMGWIGDFPSVANENYEVFSAWSPNIVYRPARCTSKPFYIDRDRFSCVSDNCDVYGFLVSESEVRISAKTMKHR